MLRISPFAHTLLLRTQAIATLVPQIGAVNLLQSRPDVIAQLLRAVGELSQVATQVCTARPSLLCIFR